ncbi:trophoblast glycoprotein [Anarrhichthys ocellatus]|uniref:trophoblast glycoprotein n=1 Tax=Anarrhichthys ocellatus TaxID=433405 RepID=UPI0012EE604B|nr:trophoblast glycoprotein [Anarrhichthys ocellatus]
MRLLSTSCGEIRGRAHMSGVVPFLLLLAAVLSCHGCPDKCLCVSQTVKCQNQDLDAIPHSLPANTKFLFVTGNYISRVGVDSFPTRLQMLTDLYLSGNEVESVDAMVFDNLPNLVRLDLSNNIIQTFSERAFPEDNKVQLLNLSRSFHNHSFMDSVLSVLQSGHLLQLTVLDLSNNDLVILPDDIFRELPNLVTLSLQNSSILSVQNGTLRAPPLRDLDLRDNSLRDLPYATLAELGLKPTLLIRLAGNPWRCDCFFEDTLLWLKNTTQVVDAQNLTCAEPKALRRQPLLQVEQSRLRCLGDMEGVLETSYVFLGLVLALIGIIFLLVLYLNRKGIKRWIYNIRDACRDHMEGYHYRYEINSDPRLANLSINSDV